MDATDLDAAVRRHVLGGAPADGLRVAARRLVELGAGSLAALVFFGSRRSQARAHAHGAYDVFVVTLDEASLYRALHDAGVVRRSPGLLALAGRVLPPSQVSLRLPGGDGATLHVKGSVIALPAFRRETSPRRRDHFCVARLFQATTVLYAREGLRDEILAALAAAHRLTFEWVRPSLPAEFDVALYGRTLLDVSMRAEIRPEPPGRAQALWEAQRGYLDDVYAALLDELHRAGRLTAVADGRYRLAERVSRREARRVRRYFRRSLVRATARWAKHMLTFEGWLDYIVHKVERHAGGPLDLTPRERRFPLVFLWPRLVRLLRARGRSGD